MTRVHSIPAPRPRDWSRLLGEPALLRHNDDIAQAAASSAGIEWNGARVLDVACGARQHGVAHVWQAAAARIGVDIDPDALRRNAGVTPICADMYDLPLASASFDVVVSVDTLEHAEFPERFLAEVARVLRPGGRFLVFTPSLFGYTAAAAKLLGNRWADMVWRAWKKQPLPYDVWYRANTKRRLSAIGAARGLELTDVVYVPLVPHFFYRSRLLGRAAHLYNLIADGVRLRPAYLYMVAAMRRR